MNLSFDILAAKLSRDKYKAWHFSREWRTAIIVMIALKTLTMIVAIYAGYEFFYSTLLPIVEKPFVASGCTVIIMVILEVLTAVFLSKFFKFILRKRFAPVIFSFLASLIFYSISFNAATKGLAMLQSAKVDQTKTIVDNYSIQATGLKNEFNSQVKRLEKEIETIKSNPAGWIDGKPTRLTPDQQEQILMYNNAIAEVRQNERDALIKLDATKQSNINANEVETTYQADRYYKFEAALMFLQLVANGVLMFFWSRIYYENYEADHKREELAQLNNEVKANIWDIVRNTVRGTSTQVAQTFAINSYESDTPNSQNTRNAPKVNPIGFRVNEKVNFSGQNNEVNQRLTDENNQKVNFSDKFNGKVNRETTWGKFLLKYHEASEEIYNRYTNDRKIDFSDMSQRYAISVSTLKNIKRVIENVLPRDY